MKRRHFRKEAAPGGEQFPGYRKYPAKEDIYMREKRVPLDADGLEENVRQHIPPLDQDLDVPGAELDDANELIGEEDEENNYYSLGGDNHHDLEEN